MYSLFHLELWIYHATFIWLIELLLRNLLRPWWESFICDLFALLFLPLEVCIFDCYPFKYNESYCASIGVYFSWNFLSFLEQDVKTIFFSLGNCLSIISSNKKSIPFLSSLWNLNEAIFGCLFTFRSIFNCIWELFHWILGVISGNTQGTLKCRGLNLGLFCEKHVINYWVISLVSLKLQFLLIVLHTIFMLSSLFIFFFLLIFFRYFSIYNILFR